MLTIGKKHIDFNIEKKLNSFLSGCFKECIGNEQQKINGQVKSVKIPEL